MEKRNQNEGKIREANNGSRGDGAWETGTCQPVGRRWAGYGERIAMRQRVSAWYSAEFRGKALTRAQVSQDKTRTAVAKTTLPQRGAKQRKGTGERGEATGRKRIREKAKSQTRASQEYPPISDSPTSRFLNTVAPGDREKGGRGKWRRRLGASETAGIRQLGL